MVSGPAGETIDLLFYLTHDCTLINQADSAGSEVLLEAADSPVKYSLRLPLNGQASLLLQTQGAISDIDIGIELREEVKNNPPEYTKFTDHFILETPKIIKLKTEFPDLPETEREEFAKDLSERDQAISKLIITQPTAFSPMDDNSLLFTVPDNLAGRFRVNSADSIGGEWYKFKNYLESLNSNDPDVPDDLRIVVPTTESEIDTILSDFLAWSYRFFESTGPLEKDANNLHISKSGPWMATAYPLSGTPAYASPDEQGRLKYDHLLSDKYAHTYRYYIRPYSRFDLFWQSIRQSTNLFPETSLEDKQKPQPAFSTDEGALDIVIERTKPVSMPLVLNSSRLDAPSTPASPAPPGTTWEVIVAKHPEQTMIEKNQTLSRQLGYRQIAFSLMRRFAYFDWTKQLEASYCQSKRNAELYPRSKPGILC